MTTVTLSPKFQVVIPKVAREPLGLKAGAKFEVMVSDGILRFIPILSAKELKGTLKGMSSDGIRDHIDRVL